MNHQLEFSTDDISSDLSDQPLSDWRTRLAGYLQISTVLRLLGGGVTILAIALFLFQHWEASTDLYRYGLLLGETALLTLLGFGTSRWLQEQKSARLFLTLSLISITAVFTILAAMLYSALQGMPANIHYPDFAVWSAGSIDTVWYLLAGSVLLLWIQARVSYSVLARPVSRQLSWMLILNLLLLMLPVRAIGIVSLLILPVVLLSHRYFMAQRTKVLALKTFEGVVAMGLTLLPLAVMLVRSAYLYAEESVAILSLAFIAYLILRQIAQSITELDTVKGFLEKVSLFPAIAVASALGEMAVRLWHWDTQWVSLLFFGVITTALMDLYLRTGKNRRAYANAILNIGLLVSAIQLILWPGALSGVIAMVLSGSVTHLGYISDRTLQLRLGLPMTVAGLVTLLVDIMGSLDLGNWMGMTILGISTIILAAAVERHSDHIKLVLAKLRH